MPDWSYKPIFQPALVRMPPTLARDLTLNSVGALMRLPMGGGIIDFMGHMRSDPRLRKAYVGITFPTRVGLGVGIDSNAVALSALARMGLGFLEVGPVVLKTQAYHHTIELCRAEEAIHYGPGFPTISADQVLAQLRLNPPLSVPLLIRLGYTEGATSAQVTEECCTLIDQLAGVAAAFVLATTPLFLQGLWQKSEWQQHFSAILHTCRQQNRDRPLMLWIPASATLAAVIGLIDATKEIAEQMNNDFAGVVIGGAIGSLSEDLHSADGALANVARSTIWSGKGTYQAAYTLVCAIRSKVAPQCCIIVSGGIHEPSQAVNLLNAGADLIQVDSGLVYSGPGLPKRINEAVLYQTVPPTPTLGEGVGEGMGEEMGEGQTSEPTGEAWFWTAWMGLSMILGGCIAVGIALMRVLLPYDESFIGMTRAELAAINPRLLPFMTHDRITLAGVMLALGIFYSALSWFAIRRGHHWAKVAVIVSALVGFATFFLFLGFGYFDPFHAFVTAILFQFLLFGLYARLPAYRVILPPSWHNDWRWQRSLWGQLLFVIQGCAIIGAGLVITLIGITQVLVVDDVEYLQTTVDTLQAANPLIVALVAHDRATLGGMLLSSGLVILMAALWGFRPGERWLWWAFVLGSMVAYTCAIAVHIEVGYLDWVHLAPALAGVGLTTAAAWLSYPYLCCAPP